MFGELGNNSRISSTMAVPVYGLSSGVQAVASNSAHTFAIVNGGVQAWGGDEIGYLGNNSTVGSLVPVHVQGLSAGVQAIAGGVTQACALQGGQVWCWGFNDGGQLGNSGKDSLVPVRVSGLPSGVEAIAAASDHTCAIVADSVWCWGHNEYELLEYYDPAPPMGPDPVKIDGLPPGLQAIAASNTLTCVLAKGSVYCWGETFLADPAINPVPWMVSGLPSAVRAIAVGGNANGASHVCALLDDGLMCWGYEYDDSNRGGPVLFPTRVQGLPSPVQAIAAGDQHTCAIAAGAVWCWGYNSAGQLGNKSTTDSAVPVQVLGLPGR